MSKKKNNTKLAVRKQEPLAEDQGSQVDVMFGGGPVQIPVDAPLPAVSACSPKFGPHEVRGFWIFDPPPIPGPFFMQI